MKVGKILTRIGDDALTANLIYYWETLGPYLRPRIVEKRRLRRKQYSERDFKIIEKTWSYYKQGLRGREALVRAHNVVTGRSDEEAVQQGLRLREELKEANATVGGMSLRDVADLASGESDIELIQDLRKIVGRMRKLNER